jgi:hypothetical protein
MPRRSAALLMASGRGESFPDHPALHGFQASRVFVRSVRIVSVPIRIWNGASAGRKRNPAVISALAHHSCLDHGIPQFADVPRRNHAE